MNKEEEKYEWRVYQLQQSGIDRDVSEKIVQAQDKLRNDVWQYLVDHRHIQPNGYFSFLIYAKNMEIKYQPSKRNTTVKLERLNATKKEI